MANLPSSGNVLSTGILCRALKFFNPLGNLWGPSCTSVDDVVFPYIVGVMVEIKNP